VSEGAAEAAGWPPVANGARLNGPHPWVAQVKQRFIWGPEAAAFNLVAQVASSASRIRRGGGGGGGEGGGGGLLNAGQIPMLRPAPTKRNRQTGFRPPPGPRPPRALPSSLVSTTR